MLQDRNQFTTDLSIGNCVTDRNMSFQLTNICRLYFIVQINEHAIN